MKAVWVGVILVVIVASPARAANPREKLETAIPEAIRLLEKKQYKEFLTTFLAPDDLKEATKEVKLDRLAEAFGKRKAAALLKAFKQIKGSKPAGKDGKSATCCLTAKAEDMPKETIRFVKVGDYWYFKN